MLYANIQKFLLYNGIFIVNCIFIMVDYKNSTGKELKENLKNNIHSLLTEANVAPVQPENAGLQPATQEVDKLASANDYSQYIALLNQMIQQADAKNMPLRQAIFDAFNNQANGGDIQMQLSNANVPVANLHPTQSEIDLSKSLIFPIQKDPSAVPQILEGTTCAPGGKQIVVFNGAYVIDGHHRWSQVFCVNPNANISALNIQCSQIKNPIDMLKATQSAIAAVKVGQGDNTPLPSQVAKPGLNIYALNPAKISMWITNNITDESVNVFANELGLLKNQQMSAKQSMYDKMFGGAIQEEEDEMSKPGTQSNTKRSVVMYLTKNCKLLKEQHGPAQGAPNRGLMPQTDDYFSEVEQALSRGTDDVVIGQVTPQQNAEGGAQQQQGQQVSNVNPDYNATSYKIQMGTGGNNLGYPNSSTGEPVNQQNMNQSLPKVQNIKNNQMQENKNNMRLTESQLKQLIAESVKRVIRENWEDDYERMLDAQTADRWYRDNNMLRRGLDKLTGKAPYIPHGYVRDEPMGKRAQRYVDAFNKKHSLGNRVDYDNGESYHAGMNYQSDTYDPVLSQTSFDGSAIAQMRKAYDKNGGYKEWGISYPYSEAGYTGEYSGDNQDILRRQKEFPGLRDEIGGKVAQAKRNSDSKNKNMRKPKDKNGKKNESVVRFTESQFNQFLAESVRMALKEMEGDAIDGRMRRKLADMADAENKRAKYDGGWGFLDEGPWEDDGNFEQERARVRGGASRWRGLDDCMEEGCDELEASWDTLERNPLYNPGGMGYEVPDDVYFGDR